MSYVLRVAVLVTIASASYQAVAQQQRGASVAFAERTPTRDSVMPSATATPGAPQPSDYQSAADLSLGQVQSGGSQSRYRYVNGQWWYYQTNNQWLVWRNNRWQETPAMQPRGSSYGGSSVISTEPTPTRDSVMPPATATPGAPQPSDYQSAADLSLGQVQSGGSQSRYRYVNGQWWYYQTNNQWLVWRNNRWQETPAMQPRGSSYGGSSVISTEPTPTRDSVMPPATATPGAPQPSDFESPADRSIAP